MVSIYNYITFLTKVTIQLQLHCCCYLYVQFVEVVAMEMGGVLMDAANASLAFKQMTTVVSGTDYKHRHQLASTACLP